MLGDTVRVRGLGSWLVSGTVRVRIGVRVRVRLRLWGEGYLGMASYMQKQVSHLSNQKRSITQQNRSFSETKQDKNYKRHDKRQDKTLADLNANLRFCASTPGKILLSTNAPNVLLLQRC